MGKQFCFAALIVFTSSMPVVAMPRSLFPTTEQIQKLGANKDWGGLQSSCRAALSLQSHPIADFSPAPHYGPAGVNKEGANAPGPSLSRDSLAVYDLSLCFAISHSKQYSSKAESILDAWASTTKRIGTLQGADAFNFYFPDALMGAYLLRHEANWSNKDFDRFVRKIVLPANNAARPNNHGNWGVLLLVTAGAYLQDQAVVTKARNRWLQLMDSQVAADGSLPREICRSDTSNWCGGPAKGIRGIAYTHYALHPTAIAAEIFRNLGMTVYSTSEGALLCKAYRRAAFWTVHPEEFPYFKSNNGELQGVHNIDYFYILQRRCPVPDGATALKEFGPAASDPLDLRNIYNKEP